MLIYLWNQLVGDETLVSDSFSVYLWLDEFPQTSPVQKAHSSWALEDTPWRMDRAALQWERFPSGPPIQDSCKSWNEGGGQLKRAVGALNVVSVVGWNTAGCIHVNSHDIRRIKRRERTNVTERNSSGADFYSSYLWNSCGHSVLSTAAPTRSFKASTSQMVCQEKNDNGWKRRGFLLLVGARKGTDWYCTNNENIVLIVIRRKLQRKQTANFRYDGCWNEKFLWF